MNCGSCGTTNAEGAQFCANCGGRLAPPPPPSAFSPAPQAVEVGAPVPPPLSPAVPGQLRYASVGKRLVGYLIEGVGVNLVSQLTCGIAGIAALVWSIILWQEGLTIGKKFLKLRVIDIRTGQPATMQVMLMRQIVYPLVVFVPIVVGLVIFYVYLLQSSLTFESDAQLASPTAFIALLFFIALSGIVSLVDALWILRKGPYPQRLVDYFAKTTVIDEDPHTTW